jgi:hypothetical protein
MLGSERRNHSEEESGGQERNELASRVQHRHGTPHGQRARQRANGRLAARADAFPETAFDVEAPRSIATDRYATGIHHYSTVMPPKIRNLG